MCVLIVVVGVVVVVADVDLVAPLMIVLLWYVTMHLCNALIYH